MEYFNYQELVKYLKQIPSQSEQFKAITMYFMDNVKFDYVMIEHINEIATTRFTNYVDRIFPSTSPESRYKALSLLRNTTNISNNYWERIKNLYLTPYKNENNIECYPTLTQALTNITPDVKEINGLLKKGIAIHIVQFAKKLCNEIGIPCLIVKGISSGKTQHFWLDVIIDNKELFYDITYAIYIRDNFCTMGKRYKPEEWLGITPRQLYKNQPTRTILYPKGFNLENLGMYDIPLCMKDCFDTPA